MKFVISPWLRKNVIPPLRAGKPERTGSSLQQLDLAHTVLQSPVALTRGVSSYRAPCRTGQRWVTPFPLPVPWRSVQLPCSSALKFSDGPAASFLSGQFGMDTKKWWWVVALRAGRVSYWYEHCARRMWLSGAWDSQHCQGNSMQWGVKLSRAPFGGCFSLSPHWDSPQDSPVLNRMNVSDGVPYLHR